jgi:hypothetical protein
MVGSRDYRHGMTAAGVCREMLNDFAEGFKLLAQGFAHAPGEIRKALIHGSVYVSLFGLVYVAAFQVRVATVAGEIELGRGLHEAYAHSWISPASGYSQVHSQAALRAGIYSDSVVSILLNRVLATAADSSRVRLALIHDGVTTITGVDMLRFDVTAAVAAPGRSPGELLENRPLTEWAPDYLPSLIKHDCKAQSVASLQNVIRRERLGAIGATWVLDCPVIDPSDQVLGSILVTWDGNDKPPTGKDLGDLMDKIKIYGYQIGSALDMQRSSN